ncbi:MAG: hypothetical protein R3F40_07610 [Candidatus Competibacteraceae bacterium]
MTVVTILLTLLRSRTNVESTQENPALAVAAAATLRGISAAQAQAVVSGNGYGQVVIYPYFTVRDGWRTFVHVTNTSGYTVATKVRFHAAKGSEDLLDFLLVLSPYDMWTAVVEERNGVPGVRPTDNSCTVPIIGKDNFQPFLTTRVDSTDAAREGYAEIIEMGWPSIMLVLLAAAAKHGSSACQPIAALSRCIWRGQHRHYPRSV